MATTAFAQIPTVALAKAFGADWHEKLSSACPDDNFDNIVKNRRTAAPKLSPNQRSDQPFNKDKCQARVIDQLQGENGLSLYKKKGLVNPGFVDFQCKSNPTDGSCFCKTHERSKGSNNLGKFCEPRPDVIKYEKHPNNEWLWSNDPRCEEYRRSDGEEKSQPKQKSKTNPKQKAKLVYAEQCWNVIVLEEKMNKDIALCYLNNFSICILDPLGKTFGVGTLRGLVKKHYSENSEKEDEPVEDEPEVEEPEVEEPEVEEPVEEPVEEENDSVLDNDDEALSDEEDEEGDGCHDIIFEGIKYKVDGFFDVYCHDEPLMMMGSIDSSWTVGEPVVKISWESKEARFKHYESKDELEIN